MPDDSPSPLSLPSAGDATMRRLRGFLLGLVVFGAVGLGLELVLLEHWGRWMQWIPLVVLTLTALGAGLLVVRPSARLVRGFRLLMAAAVVAGLIGTFLHYGSNSALERELAPDRPGGELFWRAIRGGTPTLAPGALIQLGLLGLLAVFRHPATTDDR